MKNLLIITALLSLFSFGAFAVDADTPNSADQCSSERVVDDVTLPQSNNDESGTGSAAESK